MSYIDIKNKVQAVDMPGECEQLKVRCKRHRSFNTDSNLLVADIEAAKEFIRLDRVVVTGCTKQALTTSFKCIGHICMGNTCHTEIGFMKPDGTCTKRSYKSKNYKGDKHNIDHTTITKGKIHNCQCGLLRLAKGKFCC